MLVPLASRPAPPDAASGAGLGRPAPAAGIVRAAAASARRLVVAFGPPLWRALPDWLQWRVLWLLNPKFTVGVSGVVFDAEGRVLLLEHTFRRRYPWGLLSGWVNGGEPLVAALQREAYEETKLSIEVERPLVVRKDRYHLFIEVVFLCRLVGGTFVPSNEITAIQWCMPDALPANLHPNHGPLVRWALRERSRQAGA